VRVTYTGPIDAIELPQTGAVVQRGETVDVPDALGKSLIEQSCWQQAKPTVKPANEKKEG
jgi:hypothetical protein